MNFAMEKKSSTYDFEFPREIKDAMSISPSMLGGGGGGGGSVYSSASRLRTSQSHLQSSARIVNPQPRTSVRGSDNVSCTFSASVTDLADRNGKISAVEYILECPFLVLTKRL